MKFVVKFNCDNAAFDENPGPEIARILRKVADQVNDGFVNIDLNNQHPIRDINGNRVGDFILIDDDK